MAPTGKYVMLTCLGIYYINYSIIHYISALYT